MTNILFCDHNPTEHLRSNEVGFPHAGDGCDCGGTYVALDSESAKRIEHKLGFIAPIFDALVDRDRLMADVLPSCRDAWACRWLFDSDAQLRYFATIARERGWYLRIVPSERRVITTLTEAGRNAAT